MEGSDTLSDAEMRLITINGQTIMLEGDFQNEFLNDMLMVSTSKISIDNDCGDEVNENSCDNCVKEEDEATKLEISDQGENVELEPIQIGVEEAKALGLYFYGIKAEDDVSVWDQCSINGAGEELVKSDEAKVNENEETETCKVKIHSLPVLSVSCLDREQGNLITLNDIKKMDNVLETSEETYSLSESSKIDDLIKSVQEDNPESLPAIGHLEGFQIPTTEDGVLLPATVNAKMADGSYQTITLIPQVVNGTVTYTVHFSNVVKDFLDEDTSSPLNDQDNISECYNEGDAVKEEVTENDINSVDSFLNSINSVRNNCVKNVFQENLSVQKPSANKTALSGLIGSLPDENFLRINRGEVTEIGNVLALNYVVQEQMPIETKIDNLISENESVISKCKKVKYGKKVKVDETVEAVNNLNKISKSNVTKAKKVKLKSKGGKLSSEESEKKKLKLSLLKPNSSQRLSSVNGNGVEGKKSSKTITHMNLNGRLEYPNLRAIDESTSSLPYLKVKNSNATKQPYFNVLPYPKDKIIPAQKQVLPLNCDLQQAKNLISLQKFLETQKLELKIQPLVPNGNKIVNIRPKPSPTGEGKTLQGGADPDLTQFNGKPNTQDFAQGPEQKSQEGETVKNGFQESLTVNDVLLNDGKLNCLKFLKQTKSESGGGGGGGGEGNETEKESNSNCSNKMNGIFIKNNPDYFSQRVRGGKAEEHPLGSSENPIQLVQTGHTFHSRQPLSETQLRQIASILQKQKFDSPNIKKNSIFDPKTNTRIVYRVVYPEDVDLSDVDKTSLEGMTKRKRGRHRGKAIVDDEKSSNLKGPRRPKKHSWFDDDFGEEEIEDTIPKRKIPRTRSGRLSRPPKYMYKDYKRLQNSEGSTGKHPNSKCGSNDSHYQNGKKISFDRKGNAKEQDKKLSSLKETKERCAGSGNRAQRTKRNFKPENRCPTCHKVYLGPTRMMYHLNKFPDHCNLEKYKENYYRKRNEAKARRAARRLNLCDVTNKIKQILISLPKEELTALCGPILAEALTIWDFFLLRINLLKETRKDEVDAMLHELMTLLEKLTKIAEDIFLPVFTKEAEKDDDCVEIDRMEVAIALGLPVGFYKINNDNLSVLRIPYLTECSENENENDNENEETFKVEGMFLENDPEDSKGEMFEEKSLDSWEKETGEKKLEEEPFWLENKTEDGDSWHHPEEDDSSMKTLSTKFEPNLSTKILDSSNDSIDDGKYEDPGRLMDLDSNSKDVEQSNSSGNMDESPDLSMGPDRPKRSEKEDESEGSQEKASPELWNENSTDKVSAELWNENSEREKWDETSDMVPEKSSAELWTSENSGMSESRDKPAPPHLWTENSNLTPSEKVDETNSVFLESLLSVQNSNEFLSNSGEGFLAENMGLINEKEARLKASESEESRSAKGKSEWRNDEGSYLRVWNAGKNPAWQKEESILSGGLQERMPGVRTTGRLTSTPESNGTMTFSIPNRRNSISDFTNINLEPANLDMVLPPAKSLIKDCLKDEGRKYELKGDDSVSGSFLESASDFKVKTWETDAAKPNDFVSANVNSEDLMKMALESLTSQHDVISVPPSSFDSAMGILNQGQEQGNLNLFASSETDGLDFNLPLPDHLLRGNFNPGSFQTTCASSFRASESPTYLSQTNSIFGTTCTLSNSMKFDQFETNYSGKKSKSLDEVMDFFGEKTPFNGYEPCTGNGGGSNFSFPTGSENQYSVVEGHGGENGAVGKGGVASRKGTERRRKTTGVKVRGVKKASTKSSRGGSGGGKIGKKAGVKVKKAVEYPKKTIESIINEALFDSCGSNGKTLQMENSSPNGSSSLPNGSENYSLPIIPESLDEVENLDFLNQD